MKTDFYCKWNYDKNVHQKILWIDSLMNLPWHVDHFSRGRPFFSRPRYVFGNTNRMHCHNYLPSSMKIWWNIILTVMVKKTTTVNSIHIVTQNPSLTMNGMQLHTHVPTYAIFSLRVQLLYTLFSVTGLLSVQLSIMQQLVRAIWKVKIYLYFFS